MVGLSTHGYDWNGRDATALTYRLIEEKIGDATSSVTLDKGASSAIYKYEDEDKHEVWFENAQTLKQKMLLILNKYGIDKFALWRIGAEDPKFWEELRLDQPN